jgi:hypothetical protein
LNKKQVTDGAGAVTFAAILDVVDEHATTTTTHHVTNLNAAA